MRKQLTDAIARLASQRYQERYVVRGLPPEIIYPPICFMSSLPYDAPSRAAFSDAETGAIHQLAATLQRVMESKGDSPWTTIRAAAQQAAVVLGIDVRAWEDAEIDAALDVEARPMLRRNLLKMLDGAVITRMVRYSLCPPEERVAKYGLHSSQVFSLTEGPLLLWLDSGKVIGWASQSSQRTVTLWLEQGELPAARDLHPIDAADPRYSDEYMCWLLGRRVRVASFIVCDPDAEAGVVLAFAGGGELIIAHNLHHPGDFAVLRRSQIAPEVAARMREVPIDL
jgi:hypothetical protein